MVSKEGILHAEKDRLRRRFLNYTRRAFRSLPKLHRPRILDIGCGSGVPTMELARMSDGEVVGLDIDQTILARLKQKTEEAGLSGRVKTLSCSMYDVQFPEESFDVIWAEGSIAAIGFERGLREWRPFLKADGFLVVHDEVGNLAQKLAQISRGGYHLLDYFIVSHEVWWKDYYAPLEKRISALREECADNPGVLEELRSDQQFIEIFRKNPGQYSSVFFIMQKK